MKRVKQTAVAAMQLLVVVATVLATVIMFMNPACVEHMLADVARGVSAGLLIAGVKVLVVVNRPKVVCKPVSCWCHLAWAMTGQEVKCALVAGYLVGLVVAMWVCWNR